MTETRDERADRLLGVALELVVRVRDDDPEDVARWLAATIDVGELRDTAILLAALVPDDCTPSQLLAWFTGERVKRCPGCERSLPVESFARDRSRRDGLNTYCRDCAADRYAAKRYGGAGRVA